MWDAFLQWLTNSWLDAGTQSLKDAISVLSMTPWPDLSVGWFKSLWNSIFGLALIIAVFSVVLHAVIFMFRARQGESLVGSVAILGRTLLTGLYGLAFAYGGIILSTFAIQLLTLLGNKLTQANDWTSVYATNSNMQLANLWSSLGMSWLGMSAGLLLSFQAIVSNVAIYEFSAYSLLTSGLGQTKLMQYIRSLAYGALWTAIFGRVFQIAWLVFMSIIVHYTVRDALTNANQVLFAVIVAALIPIILFITFTVRQVRIEGKVDIRNNLRERRRMRQEGLSEAEIIQKRSQKVSPVKDVLIGAATTGAIFGTEKLISKAIGPLLVKLSGIAHPAAPLVATGITAVAGRVKRAVHQKIYATSDRLGSRRTQGGA